MAVDKGYGSGYKGTGKADRTVGAKGKRTASGAERSRVKDLKSGSLGRPAGSSPFNSIKGKAIMWEELGGLAASAGLAAAGIAASRTGAGRRVIKSVTPAAPRIAAASRRIAAQSGRAAKTFQAAEDSRIATLRGMDDQIQSLRRTEVVGSDAYRTTTRMTDPLFDTWERSSTLVSDGPSAWQKAKDIASKTGQRVVGRRGSSYGDISTTSYRLEPGERALSQASELEYKLNRMRNQENDYMGYRAMKAQGRANVEEASSQIKRRLAALQRAKKNR